MKSFQDKRGNWRYRTNRRDIPQGQHTVQGESINNHQGRPGTKRKAGSQRCQCPFCTDTAKEAKEKLAQKEFKKEVKENIK